MKFKSIFFDLDGTLIDSKERLYKLFIDISGMSSITFNEYWELKMTKNSNEEILKNKFQMKDADILLFKRKWFQHIESSHYLSFDKLFPDTIEVLEQLYLKATLYVITARQFCENTINQLDKLCISKYFKAVLITEQKLSKATLINSLGLPLENCLIIGDTGEETIIGKELGLTTASVLTGFRNKSILESYQPDFIFSNLTEFAKKIVTD